MDDQCALNLTADFNTEGTQDTEKIGMFEGATVDGFVG